MTTMAKTMVKMMAADNDDNEVDGNGVTGDELDDDGNGATGKEVDDDGDCAMGDDNDGATKG